MKKSFLPVVVFLAGTFILLSWGVIGHRTVGKIAEDHLTPKALAGVRDLLGDATLADVSTWADEVRGQAEYRQTGSWHYINLPLGLDYDAFKNKVENMLEANVYSALAEQMRLITDKTVPRDKKIDALKFVVHFVGDLHQPMHVSRAEDKGGNTIQLNYDGKGTNLHSVWDSKLIEQTGLDYHQLAQQYDHPTAVQVRQWQSDPVIKWIWESYEISSKLYAEVDTMHSRSIGEDYYKAHWPVVAERLEQAGVRLAGVLNILFKDGPVTSGAGGSVAAANGARGTGATVASEPVKIDIKDAASHVDEQVVVSGQVYGYKMLDGLTLVNLGAAYPNQLLTVVLRGDAKDMGPSIDGKVVTVTGKIELYKGKPEIAIKDPKMIR